MLYRDEPLFRLPFALLNALIEIDEQLGNFRYRHLQMVRRMIGTRVGTGRKQWRAISARSGKQELHL